MNQYVIAGVATHLTRVNATHVTLDMLIQYTLLCRMACCIEYAKHKITIEHIFCFANAFWASASGGFRIVSNTFVYCAICQIRNRHFIDHCVLFL